MVKSHPVNSFQLNTYCSALPLASLLVLAFDAILKTKQTVTVDKTGVSNSSVCRRARKFSIPIGILLESSQRGLRISAHFGWDLGPSLQAGMDWYRGHELLSLTSRGLSNNVFAILAEYGEEAVAKDE